MMNNRMVFLICANIFQHIMNRCIQFTLFLALFILLQAEKYTTKWDNIDIDEILRSERLLKNYKNCLMGQGKCTPEGTELKRNLPDALKTECTRCSEKQKINTEKVIDYMIENKKDWWKELQDKYDPTGIYYNRRLERIKLEMEKEKDEKNKDEKE